MSGPQIILWVIALVVLALCARRGMPQARRAVAETNRGFWRILPMFCVALPMAAFLSELVPADIATAWLGDDSGLSGIMIASLAGGIMPGGPFVTFPLVITFSKAGAGVAQMTALLATTPGISVIKDTIFPQRFMHCAELKRMGADIKVDNGTAVVRGVAQLSAAPVMASDLRASAALVLAALTAKGSTEISRLYHIDRGYEHIDEKLLMLGADVERVKDR